MSCQIINHVHERHDKCMAMAKQFDAIVWSCNLGQIVADGGSQMKADNDMQDFAKSIPILPSADVMMLMDAKDALVKINDTEIGLVDTLCYNYPYADAYKLGAPNVPDDEKLSGVEISSHAFDSVLPGFSYPFSFIVLLFAFSTMISRSYSGEQSYFYLFGVESITKFNMTFLLFTLLGVHGL